MRNGQPGMPKTGDRVGRKIKKLKTMYFVQTKFREYRGNVYGSAYVAKYSTDGINEAGAFTKGGNIYLDDPQGFEKAQNIPFTPIPEHEIPALIEEATEKGSARHEPTGTILWRDRPYV